MCKISLSLTLVIYHQLLVWFGPNKNQHKGYSIRSLIVIVWGSISAFLRSQFTICKFYFRKKIAISRELLVQFGPKKNNKKVIASIGSSIVIVSGSFGSLVTSQITIYANFNLEIYLPYLMNYWSNLDWIKKAYSVHSFSVNKCIHYITGDYKQSFTCQN